MGGPGPAIEDIGMPAMEFMGLDMDDMGPDMGLDMGPGMEQSRTRRRVRVQLRHGGEHKCLDRKGGRKQERRWEMGNRNE